MTCEMVFVSKQTTSEEPSKLTLTTEQRNEIVDDVVGIVAGTNPELGTLPGEISSECLAREALESLVFDL